MELFNIIPVPLHIVNGTASMGFLDTISKLGYKEYIKLPHFSMIQKHFLNNSVVSWIILIGGDCKGTLVIQKLKKFRFTIPSLILLVLASVRTLGS